MLVIGLSCQFLTCKFASLLGSLPDKTSLLRAGWHSVQSGFDLVLLYFDACMRLSLLEGRLYGLKMARKRRFDKDCS